MFENLVASQGIAKKPFGSAIMSLALQGALIYGAVVATKGAAETIRAIIQDTTMVFLSPPKAPPISAPLVPMLTFAMPQSLPIALVKRSASCRLLVKIAELNPCGTSLLASIAAERSE